MTADGTLYLVLDAPFAAWRWLQAGVYRGTFPVIPPSAAWGLVLNLAGVETRGDLGEVSTPIRADAPALEIAVGAIASGTRSTLYQQLHTYPVGASGKELRARAFGRKYWIAPARREVLVDSVAAVGVRGPRELLARVADGLAGRLDVQRYGLPFAGDNQFLFRRLEVQEESPAARWYERVVELTARVRSTTRLTTNIDRAEASNTEAPLFAPMATPGPCPEAAWVRVGPTASAA
jgi:CRISPR-associated protein Cas5t